MSDAQRQQFQDEGYAVYPAVLDRAQVEELRAVLEREFAEPPTRPGDKPHIRNDVLSTIPQTRFLLAHEPFLAALRDILGEDVVVLPEMAAHHAFFGGWHKDTTSLENAGHSFHREPDFRMAQCAIYLQANSERYGGGLDIIPGSHKRRDYSESPLDKVARKLARRQGNTLSIPNDPGDLVLFDMRADHRGTPPSIPEDEIPREERKFAIFFVVAANNEHAASYREFIASRSGYEYLDGHEYPDEVRERAAAAQLTLI